MPQLEGLWVDRRWRYLSADVATDKWRADARPIVQAINTNKQSIRRVGEGEEGHLIPLFYKVNLCFGSFLGNRPSYDTPKHKIHSQTKYIGLHEHENKN